MIEHYEFGWYIIDGNRYEYDIVINLDGKVGTWEREGHIMVIDNVKKLVEQKPEVIVIGNGAEGRISVLPDVIKYIEGKGIQLIIKKTSDACKEFNNLEAQNKKVCAILHATC
jgi:hypothetical protein